MLRSRDFFVMPGYLLPTAFCAELVFDEDSGPTVCLVCEYDAVRGLGHAWGHNLASTASMAAALAIHMEAAQSTSGATTCRGRLRVLGTPSELYGEGKALLLNKNAFANVDAVLATRPAFGPGMLYYGTPCATFTRVTYHGRESSAVLCPWQGINAQDAAVAAYRNVTLLRRDLPSQWHVSEGAELLRQAHAAVKCSNPVPYDSPLGTAVLSRNRVRRHSAAGRESVTVTRAGALPARAVRQHTERARPAGTAEAAALGLHGPVSLHGLHGFIRLPATLRRYDGQRGYSDSSSWNTHSGLASLVSALFTSVVARLLAGASVQPQQQQQCPVPSGLGAVSHSVPTLCPLFALDAEPPLMGAAACCTDDAFDRCLQAGRCLALTALALLRDPALVHKVRRSFREQKASRVSSAGSTLPSEASDTDSLAPSRIPESVP
ncbi:hypothetical protein MTO96_003425 [Rhipicephalus appendiculatus]